MKVVHFWKGLFLHYDKYNKTLTKCFLPNHGEKLLKYTNDSKCFKGMTYIVFHEGTDAVDPRPVLDLPGEIHKAEADEAQVSVQPQQSLRRTKGQSVKQEMTSE